MRATAQAPKHAQSYRIALLLLLLLQCCSASAVTTVTEDSEKAMDSYYPNSSLPLELFNEHRTRSQAAGTIAQANLQTLSMTPSHPRSRLRDSTRQARTFNLFGTQPARVAIVNGYQWSYPTIAAIAEAVRASGIRPEVYCSSHTTALLDLLLITSFNE